MENLLFQTFLSLFFVSVFKGRALCSGEIKIAILTVIFGVTPNHWDGKCHRKRLFI